MPTFISAKTPDENSTTAIAEEACLQGVPMAVGYKTVRDYFTDTNSGQFNALVNQLHNHVDGKLEWFGSCVSLQTLH